MNKNIVLKVNKIWWP